MSADIRPFPAPPQASTPAQRSPGDAAAHFVAVGLNLVAIEAALADIEEERWQRGVPQRVREALGRHVRAARVALHHASAFTARGEKL